MLKEANGFSNIQGFIQTFICYFNCIVNVMKDVPCVIILIYSCHDVLAYLWDKTLLRWLSPLELVPVLAEVTDGSSSLFP